MKMSPPRVKMCDLLSDQPTMIEFTITQVVMSHVSFLRAVGLPSEVR